ncbi:peptidylprolyl isomerase [Vibrio sp. 10N.286.49.B3]|uniref:peptidylprolyl isomerase n=1 Tax=Vibrio sp. 10N.286.49.B3 TaxID=1880855 RepID=UPI000C825DD4|nr:peptidylprolyl isomerase [Vibrio sp. 10N.286.49.B3]PMH41875.1 peptidylprolyl isomerase [Vibrio sp. 10N.286.49.B3]
MMERLREGVNSIAVKIILGLIICSFVFAGVGSYLVDSGNNSAAKVGNAEISMGEFEQAYQNERNRMQAQMGDYFAQLLADPAYVASFRKSVLDRMINDLLLEQHAESLGLRVSDAQIRSMILDMPQFHSDGKFDQDIYQSALRRAGFSAESFAEYLRRDAVRSQLLTALESSDFSLPGEVDAQNALLTQTRDIRTLTLSSTELAQNVQLSDEDIQQAYQDNSARYTRPEQMKVAYIELSAEQLKAQIDISDEDAQLYYEEHLDKYSSEEQRKVSHILVQGDDEAKAQAILDELNAGADFAALAEEKSDDFGSADQGGDLGWIERDVMDPTFEAAAFELQNAGDRTGLVKSAFGYHIIQLDDVKASAAQPFADVAADIKAELTDEEAVDQFYALQTELERVAFEYPDSLDDSAEAVQQPIHTTDFISQNNAPELLSTPAVMQALRSLEVKEDGLNSDVIEVAPEHIIVVRVEDTRAEQVLPLDEVKEQVVAELSRLKGEQQSLELATQIIAGLKSGDNTALVESGLEFGELETVDRSSPLAGNVFSLAKPAEGDVVFGQSKDALGNTVIVELSSVNVLADPQYNEQIGTQFVRMNTQQDLSAILTILRHVTDIDYYIATQ